MSDVVLLLSLRASERSANDAGGRFSQLDVGAPELLAWMRGLPDGAAVSPSRQHKEALEACEVLPILQKCLDELFDQAIDVPITANIRLKIDRPNVPYGIYRPERLLACLSGPDSMGGLEGHELTCALVLVRSECPAAMVGAETLLIDRPLRSPVEVASLLARLQWEGCDHMWRKLPCAVASATGRAGFYLIGIESGSRSNRMDGAQWDAWRRSPQAHTVSALLGCYLFRCYLSAQRLERSLLTSQTDGDWDVQSRLLLHARSRHLGLMRYALLKNRAEAGAPVLGFYQHLLAVLRLDSMPTALGSLLDLSSQALAARSSYMDSSRFRTIQYVLFVASILSLAVALNAIQMPPFYQAGDKVNALQRREFWYVTAAALAVFVLLWAGFAGWRHGRRLSRAAFGLARRKTP